MNYPSYTLVEVLRDPAILQSLTLDDWNVLIPQARHALLLGRLHVLIEQNNLTDSLPSAPFNHSLSAAFFADGTIWIEL